MKLTKIFIAYSRKDKEILNNLKLHLSVLERTNKFRIWYDGLIEAGKDWDNSIKRELNTSDIILLLISKNFLSSDYCYEEEMKKAISLHKKGISRLIPIIAKDSLWEFTPFAEFQVLPKDGIPIISGSWETDDEPYTQIARSIVEIANELIVNSAFRRKDELSRSKKFGKYQNIFREKVHLAESELELGKWEKALNHYKEALEFYKPGFSPSKREINKIIKLAKNKSLFEKEYLVGENLFISEKYEQAMVHFNNALLLDETPRLLSFIEECENKLEIYEYEELIIENYEKDQPIFLIHKEGATAIIEIKNSNLNATNALNLKGELATLANQGIRYTIINLINVTFIDSVGLSALLTGNRVFSGYNQKFILCGIENENIKKLIEISKLNSILNIVNNVEDATLELEKYEK